MNTLIYDIEILRAIPNRDGSREPGIEYCEGWHDHANMGISVIGAYDYQDDRYRTFCADNFTEFLAYLAQPDYLFVSFNGIPFDNRVIAAALGVQIGEDRCYDLLRETWAANGLGPQFAYPSHAGYGLDAICERNFNVQKSGNGALAPVLWQRGHVGAVIDYCLNDVRLTKLMFDQVITGAPFVNPKDGKEMRLRKPTR